MSAVQVTPFLQVSSSQSELSNRPWSLLGQSQALLMVSALELFLLVLLSSILQLASSMKTNAMYIMCIVFIMYYMWYDLHIYIYMLVTLRCQDDKSQQWNTMSKPQRNRGAPFLHSCLVVSRPLAAWPLDSQRAARTR